MLLLTSTTVSFAQVDDILANVGTFKPKVTISDTYSEKVLTEVDEGTAFRSVVPSAERIAVSVVANLDGALPGVIDADTLVSVTAGNFDHSANLGDAADYKPTGKRVTFPLTKEVYLANGDTRDVRVGAVIYAWTAKTLTVTVTCTDSEGAGVADIAASDYIGVADPGFPVAIDNAPIDVAVIFGDATGSRRVFVRGIAKTTTKKFGSVAQDTYEELDVYDVTLQGSADVLGPVVKPVYSAKPNALNQIDIAGTAADLTEVNLDGVTINGLPTKATSVAITDTDGDGVWTWNVTGVSLKKGPNAVAVFFSDEDGNVSKVTKTYTVK